MHCSVIADGDSVMGLDLSDFPALADRSRREGTGNPTPLPNPLAGRAPYGRSLIFCFYLCIWYVISINVVSRWAATDAEKL